MLATNATNGRRGAGTGAVREPRVLESTTRTPPFLEAWRKRDDRPGAGNAAMKVLGVGDDALIVFDDFLEESSALAIRELALEANYPMLAQKSYFPGRNSDKHYVIPGLTEHIARVTGQTLTPTRRTAHGAFRVCMAGETGGGGVHIDPSHWSGVFYLSLDEHCQGGTDFYRHRPSNTIRAPVYKEDWAAWNVDSPERLWNEVIYPHTNDPSQWELRQHIPMKFNRLILFRPWLWHNAGEGFGERMENARLVYLIFFDAEVEPETG
jgi:hypothetical protein